MPPAPEPTAGGADRLRPGVHVVRRDDEHLQVGLDPPHRVILPSGGATAGLVQRLRDGGSAAPEDAGQRRIVRDLRDAGLLLDEPPTGAPSGMAALQDHGFAQGADRLAGLLRGAGVALAGTASGRAGRSVPDLVVLCSAAPLRRGVVDPLLTDGTPHLVVCGTGEPGSLRVGPLVEPGLTACLRCVDAAEADADPRRSLVLEQLAGLAAAPVDEPTLAIALAWAARDVAAYLAGGTPTTWSATVDAQAAPPTVRRWDRHPDCGCCWDELP